MRLYCPIFISQWFCKAVILLTFLQKLPQLCLDVYKFSSSIQGCSPLVESLWLFRISLPASMYNRNGLAFK